MWRIEEIVAVPVELDFSSSGQGCRAATAVTATGDCLFNAIELVDVKPATTQVQVCNCCGIPNCATGNWVVFRRIGEDVVWLPAWNEMEKGEFEMSEYSPPLFLRSKGAPVFSAGCWERLRSLQSRLPVANELPQINSRETSRVCQWAAPGKVLGEFPAEPRMNRDLLVAVTNGDLAIEADLVDHCLRYHFENAQPMETVELPASVEPIEFWLDLPGTPGWKSFAHLPDQLCFLMDDSLALMCDRGRIRSSGC
jgi:hypothetical protein